ncbi:MAG: hypothetical protein NC037_01860 [Bacteroides sp.]|nr:hypothetical protein [Bacillota bacterium]MCM1394355.1 hypothetical protein [[Eubacterium] siraeum]MCM1455260.1 hypothetical protein [Bacteroides sp.]
MDPRKVVSPKGKVSNLQVIYVDKEGGYSIATLDWENVKRVAIRWNGANENSKGYPHSFGRPTWFIMPKQIALAFAMHTNNLEMVQSIKACDDSAFC